MFQILEFTEALLATVTNRVEKHGDDDKPAVSLGIEITSGNQILDLIDPKLRPTLYTRPDDQPDLDGIEKVLQVLRCNSIDRVLLPTRHEGWSLAVEDGIDDTKPMNFGSCKLDKFSVEPKQGGTIVLRFRVGTSDVDADKLGKLAMHNAQGIWIMLTAPKPGDEKKAEPAPKGDPDATDLFAGGDGDPDDEGDGDADEEGDGEPSPSGTKATLSSEAAWPFPQSARADGSAPPQSVTIERSQPGTRTARGREKTAKALAEGSSEWLGPTGKPAKYRDAATGSTWSGRGLMPKWLKVAMERGKKLTDFEVAA